MTRETQAYRRVAQQGERDRLIVDHLSLVRHIVGRLLVQLPPGVDAQNLEAAGALGLVEAAASFNPEIGVPFAAHAGRRIRGAVLDELRRSCPLPQAMLERAARVREAEQKLSAQATLGELAAAAGLTSEATLDCLAALRLTRMLSWDESAVVADPRQESPASSAERADLVDVLADRVEQLPSQERLVVTLYYREGLRLREIGQMMNLSEARISRLLSAALFSLRQSLRSLESE